VFLGDASGKNECSEGRRFAGTHGYGEVTEYGEAPLEELGWPDQTARSVSWRGGSWYTNFRRGYVAARPYGNGAPGFFLRTHDAGFRGARTARLGAQGFRDMVDALRSEIRDVVRRAPPTVTADALCAALALEARAILAELNGQGRSLTERSPNE
jgi:hypothetical protein